MVEAVASIKIKNVLLSRKVFSPYSACHASCLALCRLPTRVCKHRDVTGSLMTRNEPCAQRKPEIGFPRTVDGIVHQRWIKTTLFPASGCPYLKCYVRCEIWTVDFRYIAEMLTTVSSNALTSIPIIWSTTLKNFCDLCCEWTKSSNALLRTIDIRTYVRTYLVAISNYVAKYLESVAIWKGGDCSWQALKV